MIYIRDFNASTGWCRGIIQCSFKCNFSQHLACMMFMFIGSSERRKSAQHRHCLVQRGLYCRVKPRCSRIKIAYFTSNKVDTAFWFCRVVYTNVIFKVIWLKIPQIFFFLRISDSLMLGAHREDFPKVQYYACKSRLYQWRIQTSDSDVYSWSPEL